MKGLELCRRYFEEYGRPLIEKYGGYGISAGVAGYGSECFGYDDEYSKDHDFEPFFYIWLDDETDRETGFELNKAYRRLPTEYLGIKAAERSLYGARKGGVITVKDFFRVFTGLDGLPRTGPEWIRIPEYALAAAVNGEIFANGCKEFSAARAELLKGYPEDVLKKKLSAALANMAQSGQYNYFRCLKRGERGAAELAAAEFVKSGLKALYLLNNAYAPFYKWIFKGAASLEKCGSLTAEFEKILTEKDLYEKGRLIEEVCAATVSELRRQGYTELGSDYLEPHAVYIAETVKDLDLKFMHLLEG